MATKCVSMIIILLAAVLNVSAQTGLQHSYGRSNNKQTKKMLTGNKYPFFF